MVCVRPAGIRRLWALLSVMAVAVFPRPAAGQQEPPVFELPEVVVPGRRPQPVASTPASVSVITREDIERLGARTVADVLFLVPEAVVRAYGGLGSLAQISVRGSTPAQVLVLLDGVPLNSVALGQADLSTISVDAVERIEVLRGPFSAIYGSGALGGVVNIVTRTADRRRALVQTGGYGRRSAVLTLPGAPAAPWLLTVTADATAGHRPNSDYQGTTLAARLALPSAGLLVHHYASDLGSPGDTAFPTPADRQSERRDLVQLTGGGPQAPASTRLYYVGDDFTFASAFGLSTYASRLWGGEAQRRWQTPGGLLTAGVEAHSQSLDALVFGSPIVAEASVAAGYLQYDTALSDRALASAGLRADVHSVYGTTLNPRAGIVYRPDGATRLRAAVGRTFRGPTFLELYFPGCSNPSLQPETAWAAEVGVERQSRQMLLAATAFGTWASSLIAGGCPPSNVGQATVRGLSVELRRLLAGGGTLVGSLTALQAADGSGAPLLRVPGVTAQLTFQRPLMAGTLTVAASYVGPRPDLDPATFATVQMPGYLDVRVRYRTATSAGATLTVGVDNALDYAYEPVAGYPAPGRTVFVTTSWEW
ncbi:MAG: TonB-dependent receptor [Armatimonadota bacterium]|nr:TonB-dependent receptor [Armatimonadota bacterium]